MDITLVKHPSWLKAVPGKEISHELSSDFTPDFWGLSALVPEGSIWVTHHSIHYNVPFMPLSSVHSSSQSWLTLCNPMNGSMSGFPVHRQLLESTQTHVHWVSDAIQPSHPLSSPSPPDPKPSQHQGLFQWVNSSHEVAKVLEFQLQDESFQWTPRTDFL